VSCPPGTTALLPLRSQNLDDGMDPTLSAPAMNLSAPAMNRGVRNNCNDGRGEVTATPSTTKLSIIQRDRFGFPSPKKKYMDSGTLSNDKPKFEKTLSCGTLANLGVR